MKFLILLSFFSTTALAHRQGYGPYLELQGPLLESGEKI